MTRVFFIVQSYFINDESQNLIFKPIFNCFARPADLTETIFQWGSKGLSNKKVKPPITTNHSLSPKLMWTNNSKIRVKFRRSCLKQDKVTFSPRKW